MDINNAMLPIAILAANINYLHHVIMIYSGDCQEGYTVTGMPNSLAVRGRV